MCGCVCVCEFEKSWIRCHSFGYCNTNDKRPNQNKMVEIFERKKVKLHGFERSNLINHRKLFNGYLND